MGSRKKGIWKIEGGDTEVSHMTSNHISLARQSPGPANCKGGWEISSWAADGAGKTIIVKEGENGSGDMVNHLLYYSSNVAHIHHKHGFPCLFWDFKFKLNFTFLSGYHSFWQLYFLTFSSQFIVYAFYTILFNLCKILYVWSSYYYLYAFPNTFYVSGNRAYLVLLCIGRAYGCITQNKQ